MGTVYRATDTRLNRFVAIKFVSTDLADASARRRFQREAQLASSLNHPHILTVYDAGEQDGRQYLVTELVDGGTLRDWITASPRSWQDVLDLVIGLADGLATAHARSEGPPTSRRCSRSRINPPIGCLSRFRCRCAS